MAEGFGAPVILRSPPSQIQTPSFMKQPLRVSSRRRSSNPFKFFGAAASIAILTGPIQAQVIPGQAPIRNFDNTSADFTWANPLNWSTDVLPGVDEVANFNAAQATVANINLGAQ